MLYAVGIVELELESTSAFVLLLFVIPLAFTLSGFLIWILYALNGTSITNPAVSHIHFLASATISQLAARKQRYKLSMFTWLYRILLMTVIVIAIFFVVSSLVFSGRLAEGTPNEPLHAHCCSSMSSDYGAKSWQVQWWLLDGWLALLYLVDFTTIAWLWRPSPNNRRYVFPKKCFFGCETNLLVSTLAMFDEIAQNEEDAEDYDLEAIERRTEARAAVDIEDDAATLVGHRGPGSIAEDAVVFEIGDEDAQELSEDEDPASAKKRRAPHTAQDGQEFEREGLMKDE